MKHIRWKGGERVRTKLMEEGEMKGEIEDEMMEEEREKERERRLLSPLKVPDSIETSLLD